MMNRLRLGVNIDHVATIRNARGGPHPDPVRAARLAADAGADGITAHLREDRRHISDDDIVRLRRLALPLNLEMAPTGEMLDIALRYKPNAVCLVPERREERTTEGGLDIDRASNHLTAWGRLRPSQTSPSSISAISWLARRSMAASTAPSSACAPSWTGPARRRLARKAPERYARV